MEARNIKIQQSWRMLKMYENMCSNNFMCKSIVIGLFKYPPMQGLVFH